MLPYFQGSLNSLYVYDATMVYLKLVNETIQQHEDFTNGTLLIDKTRDRVFSGKKATIVRSNYSCLY